MTTTTQIKEPILLNLDSMSQALGSFHIPGSMLASGLRLGDVLTVKAYISPNQSENVSLSLAVINGEVLTGVVLTPTLFGDKHGLNQGDCARFCADNVWDVQKID